MNDTLLVLNAGSSSVKFQLFEYETLALLAKGEVVHIGAQPTLEAVTTATDETFSEMLQPNATQEVAIARLVAFVESHGCGWHVKAVAHRITHGGAHYIEPVLIDRRVYEDLEKLSPLAPLHQPHNLAAIDIVDALIGAKRPEPVPQIACFDTAFHAGHEPLFTTFALTADARKQGVRRYGFHGLSYEWIATALAADHPDLCAGRVVIAHLGSGASLCAMVNGKSVDTTMSMTPLDGLPMGTRCGAVDPGALMYMIRHLGMSVDDLERALYEQSGLLGLSGVSNDVEVLLGNPDSETGFALDYFALKVAQYAAMMAVSMGGMEAFVFTGGIGEHAPSLREAIMSRLSHLGDVRVLVIPANEARTMALGAKRRLEASM
jgi:acetate kinase